MASANSTDKLIIFKGDDTGGTFGRRLAFTIEAGEGVDLSGCHAEWIFDGIVKTFAAPLIPGEVREVFYSHNETRCMALGVRYGTFRIIDAAGKVRTLTNTKPVEVTNNAARCYPGSSDASFVVRGIGDMKHSEFADLEEKEGMTLKEVGGMVNTLIRKLKGTVSAFAALLAFSAFCAVADGAITPDTDFGDISPTAKLKAVVEASGAISGIDTNAVDILANSAVVTNALTVATTNRVAAHVANTDNPHAVTAAQIGAVPFVEDASGEKTAVLIGKPASDIPINFGANSLANGDLVTASGSFSHAEGYYTGAYGNFSHAEGEYATASGHGAHAEGYNTYAVGKCSHTDGVNACTQDGDNYAYAWNGDENKQYFSHGAGTFNINPKDGLNGLFIGEQTLAAVILGSVTNSISAENPTFSNAVLAVGLNIDTNSVAVLNDIATTFGGFPLGAGETATTVGGLLAALAAAIAWLKKNKVQTLKLEDGSVEKTAENGIAKLDDFFTESNSLLTGTIDAEVISKGTAPDAHLEAPTDEHLKLILADSSVAYDSAKALPYKLTSAIGDRVIATMTLTAASTDITLPTISADDTTVKDFILDVTNAYAVEGVATDAGINIPRTDFKLVTRDGESLTDVTTVKAGKSAFICFTQKSPVVVDGTTYPCWCVIQLPFGDPS